MNLTHAGHFEFISKCPLCPAIDSTCVDEIPWPPEAGLVLFWEVIYSTGGSLEHLGFLGWAASTPKANLHLPMIHTTGTDHTGGEGGGVQFITIRNVIPTTTDNSQAKY